MVEREDDPLLGKLLGGRALLALALLSFSCTGAPRRSVHTPTYVLESSAADFQSKVPREPGTLALWMSRSDADFVPVEVMEQLAGALQLTPADGAPRTPAVRSKNYDQAFLPGAGWPQPAELVVDVSTSSATGWNTLDIGLPVAAQWKDVANQTTAAIHFRADSFPVVSAIRFHDASFNVQLSEPVDGDLGKALVVSDGASRLSCSSEWGNNHLLVSVTCPSPLPGSLTVQLEDGVLAAGSQPVRSVRGEPFSVTVGIADLPLTNDEAHLWLASL